MRRGSPLANRQVRLALFSARRFLDTGNFIRSLVAVVLAFGLWAWVTYENDPETSRTMGGMPVQIENLSTQFEIVGEPPVVDVQLRGPQSVVGPMERESVQASVSLQDVDEPGQYELPVSVRTPSGVRVRETLPESVIIEIDRITGRSGISVELIQPDDVPPNYQVRDIEADPEDVSIRGPERSLNRVSHVMATVSIDGRTASFSDLVELAPIDEHGDIVAGVQVEPSEVTVTVTLDVRGQVRKIIPVIVGEDSLAAGYELVRTTVLPSDEIVIDGSEEDLAEVFFVTTVPIDISGWDDSEIVRDVEIDTSRLPPGITLDTHSVHVSIEVRRQVHQREITGIPINVMNPSPGSGITLNPETATVVIEGSQSAIDAISAEEITVFVNVANAEEGSYELEARVIVPAQVQHREVRPTFIEVEIVQVNDEDLEGT